MTGTIDVPATPENQELARRVAARMAADSRIVNAKAAFWRTTGIGALLGMSGLGVAAAIFAYSYVADVRSSADKIAVALADALQKNTLKTEGTVVLDPTAKVALTDTHLSLADARVRLEPGASVALRDGGAVAIKPGATVGVAGTVQANGTVTVAGQMTQANTGEDIAGIRRAVDQIRTERRGAATEYGQNGAKVMDSVTTFKKVKYGTGEVWTGWNWEDSNSDRPSAQYCYYSQGEGGASVRIDLASNGREIPVTRAPRGFQAQDAAANCIWYDGQRTRGRGAFD